MLRDAEETNFDFEEGWLQRLQELEQVVQQQIPQQEFLVELLPMQHGTIASASDPMAYFRKLVCKPILPAAATMSTHDLAQLQREVILEAAVQQQLLSMTPPDQQEPLINKMQKCWDRYFHAMQSLFLLGRAHIYEGLAVYNLETLQPDPEGAAEYETVIRSRIDHLQLTPLQQQAIAVGAELHTACMHNILLARQQVQSEQAVSPGSARGGDSDNSMDCSTDPTQGSSSSSGGGGTSGNAGGLAATMLDTLRGRQQQLQVAKDQVAKLELLLREMAQLRILTWGWLIGCLSWSQMTLLGTICWPYTHRPAVFAEAVMVQRQQQQQAGSSPP